MVKDLVKLYIKALILLSPLLILLISFLVFDPFAVIYKSVPDFESSEDFQTTEFYIEKTKEVDYNSFIFGNSKTLAFLNRDWKTHVNRCMSFKFGCPGESIWNIYNKIKLIEKSGDKMENCLMVLDADIIANFKNTKKYFQGPVYKHHYITSGESAMIFYFTFFKYYLSDGFFVKCIMKNLKGSSINKESLKPEGHQNNFNEFINTEIESEIEKNGYSFYKNKHKEFFKSEMFKVDTSTEKLIENNLKSEDLNYLKEIKLFFDKYNVKYRIIISPTLTKAKFSLSNLNALKNIFDSRNVYDFSGDNTISRDTTNFYDVSHYRPIVGKFILDSVYRIEK